MRKYISVAVSIAIVVLFAMNFENLFSYESKVTSDYIDDGYYVDEVGMVEEEVHQNIWDDRPSLSDLMVNSGNLTDTVLKFDKPVDSEEPLDESEEKKIFFFGSPEDVIVTDNNVSNSESDWDYWGEDWNLNSGSTTPSTGSSNTGSSSSQNLEPIEVDLESFMGLK